METPKPYHQKASSMAEADWSELPSELLQLISEKLNNSELYLLRFRSVCSSWRRSSSISPNYFHSQYLPLNRPQLLNPKKRFDYKSYLIKHNILLIKPPKHQQTCHCHPWLVRIGPDSNGKIHLWRPFLLHLSPISFSTRRVFDFNQFSIFDLGHMFYINHTSVGGGLYSFFVTTCKGEREQSFVIVTVDFSYRVLLLFHDKNESWTTIPNMSISTGGNICVFKGRPCLVDKTGRTVMIGPDSSVHLLAEPVFGGQSKSLIKSSEFDSLLVDRYHNDHHAIVWIEVFRLDEKEKKWMKLTNIGDKVLFITDGCLFSTSASDLGFANGNCVIYRTYSRRLMIFHLDQGRISPLSKYPDYFKLFSSTPEWIAELNL